MNNDKVSRRLLKNLGSFSRSSTPEIVLEVPPPVLPADDPAQAVCSLYRAISHLIECGCDLPQHSTTAGRVHRGCLQLSRTKVPTTKGGHVFDTLFAIAQAHCSSPITVWRHIRILTPRKVAQVAFQVDEACRESQYYDEEPQQLSEDPRLLTDLCELLAKDFGPNRSTLVVNNSQLFDTQDQDIADFDVLHADSLSLEEALKSHTPTGQARLLLAEIVAQSFWHFYGTDWMRTRWTSEIIHFLPQSDGFPSRELQTRMDPIYDPLKPFAHMAFDETQVAGSDLRLDHIQGVDKPVHRAPQILALGAILTKILDPERSSVTQARNSLEVKLLNYECFEHRARIRDPAWPVGAPHEFARKVLRDAVLACLDASNFKQPPSCVEERRKWLYDNVVWPISYIADICKLDKEGAKFVPASSAISGSHGLSPLQSEIDPAMTKTKSSETWRQSNHLIAPKDPGKDSRSEPSNACRPIPMTGRYVALILWFLDFILITIPCSDGSKKWIDSIRQSALSRDVGNLYRGSSKGGRNRIKLAILDTGYLPDRFDIRDRERVRWKDFVGDGSPHPCDASHDLHGSTVLQLAKRLAPDTEVFVARIAKSSEELRGISPIAGNSICEVRGCRLS